MLGNVLFFAYIINFAAMQKISVNIVNTSLNPLPSYATAGSAGMDLRANLQQPVVLEPLQRQLVPTGLFIELPAGYEAQVRPRSGLAINHGITCLNSPGTVDSDYRGELKVILINLGHEAHEIKNGDRIAQMVISKVEQAELNLAQNLTLTVRGEGGFGHTGKH
jgi:dUTP pyrophosphatase